MGANMGLIPATGYYRIFEEEERRLQDPVNYKQTHSRFCPHCNHELPPKDFGVLDCGGSNDNDTQGNSTSPLNAESSCKTEDHEILVNEKGRGDSLQEAPGKTGDNPQILPPHSLKNRNKSRKLNQVADCGDNAESHLDDAPCDRSGRSISPDNRQ